MAKLVFCISVLFHSIILIIANPYSLSRIMDEPFQQYTPLWYTLKHAFGHHSCVQVITDRSPLALDVMSQMYKIAPTWTFINGIRIDVKNCNGYVVIAKNLKYLKFLLSKIPLYFQNRIVCLIDGGWNTNLNTFLQEVDRHFKDSEVLIAMMGSIPSFYKRIQPNSFFTRLIYPLGEWSQEEYAISDFKEKEIIVGAFNCCIFSELGTMDGDSEAVAIKGAEIKLLQEIFKRLNLTYKIKVPSDGDPWGRLVRGKWSGGVLKMVNKGDVDIAICGLLITYPKEVSGIEMSYPLGQLCMRLLVPKPKLLSTKWYDIVSPFQGSLWMSIIAVIITGAFFLQIFKKFTRLDDQSDKGHNFLICLLQVISIFLLSGVLKTKRGALRQLVTWLVVFSLVLTTCFSSGLISNLTSPRYTKKIETIKELYRNGFFWTTSTVPDLEVMFDQEDYWQNLWTKRLRVIPLEEEVERLMMSGKLVKYGKQYKEAFFFEEHFNKEVLEEFEVASYCNQKYFFSFANRRGSPYIESFKKFIHRFHNGGLIEKVMNDAVNELVLHQPYVKEVLHMTKGRMGVPQVLRLNNLRGAFFIWSIGIAVSFVSFVIEKYFSQWNKCIDICY